MADNEDISRLTGDNIPSNPSNPSDIESYLNNYKDEVSKIIGERYNDQNIDNSEKERIIDDLVSQKRSELENNEQNVPSSRPNNDHTQRANENNEPSNEADSFISGDINNVADNNNNNNNNNNNVVNEPHIEHRMNDFSNDSVLENDNSNTEDSSFHDNSEIDLNNAPEDYTQYDSKGITNEVDTDSVNDNINTDEPLNDVLSNNTTDNNPDGFQTSNPPNDFHYEPTQFDEGISADPRQVINQSDNTNIESDHEDIDSDLQRLLNEDLDKINQEPIEEELPEEKLSNMSSPLDNTNKPNNSIPLGANRPNEESNDDNELDELLSENPDDKELDDLLSEDPDAESNSDKTLQGVSPVSGSVDDKENSEETEPEQSEESGDEKDPEDDDSSKDESSDKEDSEYDKSQEDKDKESDDKGGVDPEEAPNDKSTSENNSDSLENNAEESKDDAENKEDASDGDKENSDSDSNSSSENNNSGDKDSKESDSSLLNGALAAGVAAGAAGGATKAGASSLEDELKANSPSNIPGLPSGSKPSDVPNPFDNIDKGKKSPDIDPFAAQDNKKADGKDSDKGKKKNNGFTEDEISKSNPLSKNNGSKDPTDKKAADAIADKIKDAKTASKAAAAAATGNYVSAAYNTLKIFQRDKKNNKWPLIIALSLVIILLLGIVSFSSLALLGAGYKQRNQNEPQRCELIDADTVAGKSGGGRGVPEGEYSKPIDMPPNAITSGWRSPARPGHRGVDIADGTGSDPLYATEKGIVVTVDTGSDPTGYGAYIIIESEETGANFLYGHMFPNTIEVEVGDTVLPGQKIAMEGYNGGVSPPGVGGTHLHFEFKPNANGNYFGAEDVDPAEYIEGGSNPADYSGGGTSNSNEVDAEQASGNIDIKVNPVDDQKVSYFAQDNNRDNNDEEVKPESGKSGDPVKEARKYIGTRYVWGGESLEEGGFDCSGFIYASYKDAGIPIEARTSEQQFATGQKVWLPSDGNIRDNLDKLKPGDVVVYNDKNHVALYIGDGKIWHASTESVPNGPTEEGIPIEEGGSSIDGVVRFKGVKSSGLRSSSGSEGDMTGTCCGGTNETFGKTSGLTDDGNNPRDVADIMKKNISTIIESGKRKSIPDQTIRAAIGIALERSGAKNLANKAENFIGSESVTPEELQRSLDLEHDGISNDGGKLGIFQLDAGKDGSVKDLMSVSFQSDLIFDKIKAANAINKDYNDTARELGFPNADYNKYIDKVKDLYTDFANEAPDNDLSETTTDSRNHNSTVIIGDSLTVGVENKLKDELPGVEVIAKVSKRFNSIPDNKGGIDILKEVSERDNKPDIVVMALGTNGPAIKEQIEEAKGIAEGAGIKLILTTVAEGAVGKDETNENIKSSGLSYIDIDSVINEPEISEDGVHYNEVGKNKFVEELKKGISEYGGATGSNDDTIEEKCAPNEDGSSSSYSADLDTTEIPDDLVPLISKAAETCSEVTAPFIAAILYQESRFDPNAGSAVGAMGIAQFMATTWATWGEGGDVWDPKDAIPASARFLCSLVPGAKEVADNPGVDDTVLELVAASYNGGPGSIQPGTCTEQPNGGVPRCGDPNNYSSYAAQTYPYAKIHIPEWMEKFSK